MPTANIVMAESHQTSTAPLSQENSLLQTPHTGIVSGRKLSSQFIKSTFNTSAKRAGAGSFQVTPSGPYSQNETTPTEQFAILKKHKYQL